MNGYKILKCFRKEKRVSGELPCPATGLIPFLFVNVSCKITKNPTLLPVDFKTHDSDTDSGWPLIREKSGKFDFSSRSGKSQGICKLVREILNNQESQGKVREFQNFGPKCVL